MPRSSSTNYCVALVTAPDLKTARRLARHALDARLAACVNIVPKLESHYRWQGRLESGAESLLLLKTSRKKTRALQACILEQHPYDTPEFIVLPVTTGSPAYLQWLGASLASG